ncbi:MAG: esterase-like activity of phytase family protein [Xanthobacteraceae bacterium]
MSLRVFLIVTSALVAPVANAVPVLIADGTLSGTADLSGLSGALENGIAGNFLGGLGSGLAYAGGSSFLAVPDRGPNAKAYNPLVDDTTSYISRFQTVNMTLTPSGGSLPFTLTPTLTKTTLLSSPTPLFYGTGAGLGNKIDGVTPIGSGAPTQNTANTFYFTGRSDNFDPTKNSGNPSNARFDPESIRVSNDGKSVFISDEYGPYVKQFDRATGQLVKTFALPSSGPGNLDVTNSSPVGATEISGNTSGRVANKGMEGLALTPDGKTLVGIMQAPLIQDAAVAASKNLLRIVTIDIATGTTHQYGYNLTTGSGVSDIVAINDHQFLVDERDGKGLGDGSNAAVKQIFKIDLAGATDITNLSGAAAAAAAVTKPATPFLDLVSALIAHGLTAAQIPSKIEGISFGPDVMVNGLLKHTLWISNDNDFDPTNSGQNKFYVFSFDDSDLPGFEAQQIDQTPLPASAVLFGTGLLGLLRPRRRRRTAAV